MKPILFVIIVTTVMININCSTAPSCISIVPPRMALTGEKTVIERQIVGQYKELEKDAWIISSVQTTVQRSKGQSAKVSGDRELIRALNIREIHKDKINKYKKEGSIGEANSGYIQYRKLKKYEKNKNDKTILLTVLKNENDARLIIFKRSLVKRGIVKPDENDINKFAKIFADEQRIRAGKNHWIQNKNGRWYRK